MENKPQKKQLPAFLILTIISVVAAVVLAMTNMVTAGPIAEHAMAALKEAFNAVMPAESYEAMTVPADYEVSSLYAAKNGDEVIGYCVTASTTGYGGPVAVTLGVDTNGVVTGCSVGDTSFAETAGFGARAKEASFQAQFPGISAINGGAFEALSGATVTSEAVRSATNKGLRCVAEVALQKTPAVDPLVTFGAPAGKAETTNDPVAPVGEVLTAAAPGFNGADVGVSVTMNADGTIATLTLDLSQQVPPVCDLCNGEDFLNQFIGKAGPFVKGENVDIVTGATYTSEGVIAALNQLFTADAFASGETRTASAPGFAGADVGVTAVMNSDGTIAELTFDMSQQVPPVCDLCDTEEFKAQFIGKKGPFVKGENVDIVTGATFTSEGIIAALNQMFTEEAPAEAPATVIAEGDNAAVAVKDDGAAIVTPNEGYTGEVTVNLSVEDGKVTAGEFAAPVEEAPAGETFTGKAQGYQSEVTVTLTVDAGVITSIKVDSASETTGFGTRCAEDEAFLSQFVGKKATPDLGEGIDALSGATVTSNAVVKAANAAIGVDVAVVEAPADTTAAATAAATATTEEVKVEETAPAGETFTGTAGGFQSDVTVTLTVADGVITAITVDSAGETPGFGTRCAEDEAFLNQFIGKKVEVFTLGENVDALSGATVTSTAVVNAINASSTVAATAEAVEEVPAETADAPAAEELTAAAAGFAGKDVGVAVTLNEDGTIATLTLDLSQQVPPVCDLCNGEEFLNQFIGKKGPFVKGEGVDIVTGATFTSDGVINALNTLFTEEEKVEEAPAEPAAPAAEELTAAAAGFAGKDVGVAVTLNEDGTIATLTLDLSQQVPPVCDLCNDEAFLNQFIGKKGPFVKGEGVDIVTGATFTSDGVINALNTLFPEEEKVEEAPAETAAPAAEELTAVAPGFLDSEVGVTATMNADGTIAALAFDLSKQVPPACNLCDTEEFKAQFIGKKGPFVVGEVDVVTGATFTSEGIIEALNKLFQ